MGYTQTMPREEAGERFWDYALAVYGRDAARSAFLDLQMTCDADVPMLLWCLWCGSEGREMTGDAMEAAVAFSAAWRTEAVLPLRALRRRMKDGAEGTPPDLFEEARGLVARTEQNVERLQMEHLTSLAPQVTGDPSREEMGRAIAGYAAVAGLALDPVPVRVLLDHADPD